MAAKRNRRRRRSAKIRDTSKIAISASYDGPQRQGPGQILTPERFAEKTAGDTTRLRNIGESPLYALYHAEKISEPLFLAGEHYRQLFEKRGRDGFSSIPDGGPGGGSNSTPFTQTQVDAIRAVERIESFLHMDNKNIIRKLCGEGYGVKESVMASVPCHPDGVLYRAIEALHRLAQAVHEARRRPAA